MGYSIPSDLNILNAVKAKTDNLPATPANEATLTPVATAVATLPPALSNFENASLPFNSGVSNGYSAYQEIVASTSRVTYELSISFGIVGGAAGGNFGIIFAIGAAGLEQEIGGIGGSYTAGQAQSGSHRIKRKIPAGTRVTCKAKTSAANAVAVNTETYLEQV